MPQNSRCRFEGCKSKRGIIDGYCRVHHWHADPPKSPKNDAVKNKELNKQLESMAVMIKGLQRETLELNNQLYVQSEENKILKDENETLRRENGDLKQRINMNFLATDSQNQYGRKESARIRNYPEATDRKKDNETAMKAVIDTASKMGVTIVEEDIQRCHRIGKFKEGQMRPVIVKFRWYKKRMNFLTNKKKLKLDTDGLSISEKKEKIKTAVFVTEDLTPYRGKVFRFIRDYNKEKRLYDIVTTHNGMISIKKNIEDKEWINISSSLDFDDLGIPRDKYEKEFCELLF